MGVLFSNRCRRNGKRRLDESFNDKINVSSCEEFYDVLRHGAITVHS